MDRSQVSFLVNSALGISDQLDMAAYAPQFGWDVFISYAQVDDAVPPALTDHVRYGWVTTLAQNLEFKLNQKLGRAGKVKIWRDSRSLAVGDPIDDTLRHDLESSAVMLIILSRAYVHPECYCRRELEIFEAVTLGRAASEGRVFVVGRDGTPIDALPRPFQNSLAITFLDADGRTLADPIPNPQERLYFDQVDRLATGLAARLDRFHSVQENTSPQKLSFASDTSNMAVLLGETSPDLLEASVSVRRYLEQAGIRVLPHKLYSRIPDKHQVSLEADLAECAFFVQLLGPYPWLRMDELPDGYEGMQLGRAVAAGKSVLRWRSRDLNPTAVPDPLHREQLDAANVLAMDLEEFKRTLVDQVRRRMIRKPRAPAANADHYVLLSSSKRDLSVADEIAAELNRTGISYHIVDERTPLDELAQSDDYNALIVVYGCCEQDWVANQVRLCRKIMLHRKSDPLRCAVYIGPPETKEPLRCKPPKIQVIEWRNQQAWHDFLDWARAEEPKS